MSCGAITFRCRELARLQTAAENALPDSGTVYVKQSTSDGIGGFVETYPATPGTVLSCRITRNRQMGFERIAGDRPVSVGDFICLFPAGSQINNTDRVACNGVTWEVVNTDEGISEAVNLRVEIKRVV